MTVQEGRRRVADEGKDGCRRLSDPRDHRDRKGDWLEFFDREKANWALKLLEDNPGIIEEYRDNPLSGKGHQSIALEKFQNYLRTHPVRGKYYIYAEEPWKKYRISILTARGKPPTIESDKVYASEAEAGFAVLMHRIALLRGDAG